MGKTNKVVSKYVTHKELPALVKRAITNMAEKKFHDVQIAQTPGFWDWNGAVSALSNIAIGTSDSTRVGDSIRLRKLSLKYNIYAGLTNSTVRCIVFRWKLRYATDVPTAGAIIKSTFVGTQNAPVGALDHDNRLASNILSDRSYSIGPGSDTVHRVSLSIDLKDSQVQYHNGSTTDQQYGIYVLFINDNSAAANSAQVTGIARVTYIDM